MSDTTVLSRMLFADVRKCTTLGVIDAFSGECLAIEVDTDFASRVTKECAFCAISVIRNISKLKTSPP